MTAQTTDFSGLLFYNPSTNGFNPVVSASLFADNTSVNEGDQLNFTVVTWNVPDGTTLYYRIVGLSNMNYNQFTDVNDSVVITNNRGYFSVGILENQLTAAGTQTFDIIIEKTFGGGSQLAIIAGITVNDTSQSILTPQSFAFNGSTDYRELLGTTTDWALGTTWTIEWWSKATSASTGGGTIYTVMSQYDNLGGIGIDIYYQNNKLVINNGTILADEPTSGVWTHVALVNNAGSTTLYYNGTSVYTGGNWNLGLSTATLVLGKRGQIPYQYFPGLLTSIRITNTAVYSTSRYTSTVVYSPPPVLPEFLYGKIKITVNDAGAVYLQFQASLPTITNQLTVGARVVLDWDGRPGNTVATIAGPSIDFPGNPYPGDPGFLLTIISTTELPGNSEGYNIEALTVVPVFDPYTVALPPDKITGTKLLLNPNDTVMFDDLSDSNHTFAASMTGQSSDYPPAPSYNKVISLNPNYIALQGGNNIPNEVDSGSSAAALSAPFTGTLAQNGTLNFTGQNSALLLPAKNIKTIGMWIKITAPQSGTMYLVDSRVINGSGEGTGYFYSSGFEGWTLMSINGAPADTSNWATIINNTNNWQYVTIINQTNTPHSITLFNRYTLGEGLYNSQVGWVEAWDYVLNDTQINTAYLAHSTDYTITTPNALQITVGYASQGGTTPNNTVALSGVPGGQWTAIRNASSYVGKHGDNTTFSMTYIEDDDSGIFTFGVGTESSFQADSFWYVP